MNSKTIIIFCLFLLSGCSSRYESCGGQRVLYQSTISSYHETDPLTSGKELSLEHLIAIGLKNNPDTKRAWATACSAYAFHKQTLSDNYPELNVVDSAKYTHISGEEKSLSSTNTTYNYNLLASYLLFDFGTRHYTHSSSRFAFCAAQWRKDFTFQKVILEVIEQYTNYLQSRETLKAREADLEDAKMSLDVGEAHYRAGIRTKADYLQVKSEYVDTQIQLEEEKGNMEIAFANLKNALGIPVQTPLLIADLPEDFSPQDLNFVVDALIETGETSRKDLLAVCATAEQKKADWKTASTQGWPTLSADWIYGRTYNATPKERHHNVGGITISIPICQWGLESFA